MTAMTQDQVQGWVDWAAQTRQLADAVSGIVNDGRPLEESMKWADARDMAQELNDYTGMALMRLKVCADDPHQAPPPAP